MERRPATYRTQVPVSRKHLRKFPTQLVRASVCLMPHLGEGRDRKGHICDCWPRHGRKFPLQKSMKPTDSSFLVLSLPTGYPLSSMMEETRVHLETQYTVVTNVRRKMGLRPQGSVKFVGTRKDYVRDRCVWHSLSSPRWTVPLQIWETEILRAQSPLIKAHRGTFMSPSSVITKFTRAPWVSWQDRLCGGHTGCFGHRDIKAMHAKVKTGEEILLNKHHGWTTWRARCAQPHSLEILPSCSDMT